MASIFTYETGTVSLDSPWPTVRGHSQADIRRLAQLTHETREIEKLVDYGIKKLKPEPQDGPVEYKLHLMLRQRRSFSATSTVGKISGSYQSRSRGPNPRHDSGPTLRSSTPILSSSSVSRQNRLHHLTTQLLWRLQQSCPNHQWSRSDLVVPTLPETDIQKSLSRGPIKPKEGLEESQGALYEIGVSDDGSFVGLMEEEMDESLMILRAMAYSIGCQVEVLRTVDVGECQWNEDSDTAENRSLERRARLRVAEVLVSPCVTSSSVRASGDSLIISNNHVKSFPKDDANGSAHINNQQLRVSLTGSTTSGKSSLLGTLSTSTLDNGRGTSRLSLLKHRHEIDSGITSSIAQELLGYHDLDSPDETKDTTTEIVNYATSHVSSWSDIHDLAQPGRLVFVTDSAGHPRYRRTTVRGLVSWVPDWTLCCVAADENDDNSGRVGATASASDILGSSGQGMDLSKAHLELCLKLRLSLVVVITKLDLASKNGLRQTLSKVLSTLKDAGRKPMILPNAPIHGHNSLHRLLLEEDNEAVRKAIDPTASQDCDLVVPIVLTSALTGAGISKVHSLLRYLPLAQNSTKMANRGNEESEVLFHIDEVFTLAQQYEKLTSTSLSPPSDFILSGYLRYGSLEIGQKVLIGPSSFEDAVESDDPPQVSEARSYPSQTKKISKEAAGLNGLHRAFSGSIKISSESPRVPSDTQHIWHEVTVTSIRYLRLPVRALYTGQVATVGITFSKSSMSLNLDGDVAQPPIPSLRRGMVLHGSGNDLVIGSPFPPAYTTFAAVFKESNTYVIPGSSVTVYIASIRTLAKIVGVKVPETTDEFTGDSGEVFAFDDDNGDEVVGHVNGSGHIKGGLSNQPGPEAIEITFQFVSSREWIEIGTQVLVIPASGLSMVNPPERGEVGGTGLDGFVGKIVSARV